MVAALLAIALQTGPAPAQSAGNFGAKPVPSDVPPQAAKKPVAEGNKENKATAILPSRFVGEADYDAYIQSLTTQFSMNNRQTDPFGQLQDPNAKPVIKSAVAKNTKRVVQVQATPFPEIINQIRVNAIMPGEGKFLIAARTYTQGGSLSIIHRGKTIMARILSVKASAIEFKNSDTGETATLKIDPLPVGMTPGTSGISAPGMSSDAQEAPINLDVGTP